MKSDEPEILIQQEIEVLIFNLSMEVEDNPFHAGTVRNYVREIWSKLNELENMEDLAN